MLGYYVHHHGQGHLARARAVLAHLRTPATVLSSLPRPDDFPKRFGWVSLPADDTPIEGGMRTPEAGGWLHWAPELHPGYRHRMEVIARWAGDAGAVGLHVDISVEVTLFARLLGLPVSITAQPGARDDLPHRLAAQAATRIVGPWPSELGTAAWLRPHREKVVAVGGVSRFEHRPLRPAGLDVGPLGHTRSPGARPVVVMLGGAGGTAVTADDVARAALATPDWEWRPIGPPAGPWTADPWPELARADVVVTSAGLGSLADVAAARRPAVIIPQDRPFDEQRASAAAIDRAGLAVVSDHWPSPDRWPELLAAAGRQGGSGWEHWRVEGAAARFAAELDRLADGAGQSSSWERPPPAGEQPPPPT